MTNRQTLPELLARLTEDRHTAEVDSLRRVIAEERARADRLLAEASNLREMLDDAIESLELLVPVPATATADTIAPQSVIDDAGAPVVVPAGLVADADGWYPHDGTAWPACAPGDEVDYWLRDGDVNRDIVGMLRWGHNGDLGDIIAWRPVRKGGPDKRDI